MSLFTVEPAQYRKLLEQKVGTFKQALADLDKSFEQYPIEVFLSPESHYRLRAEFKVWHEGDYAQYAMTDPETKKPVFMQEFPVASKAINKLMPSLMAAINSNSCLRRKLFQLNFLSTLTEDTLVTLIYHRPLDEDWLVVAGQLKNELNIQLVGRSHKQKLVLEREYVEEQFVVEGRTYRYQQVEGAFTQPNGKVCQLMLTWAVQQSRGIGGDLLELYCGNGNFTLPLAQNFDRVLATEISKTSVASAQCNIADNNIENIRVVRLSSEEFVEAINGVRKFRRLQHINLDSYHFSTVFVDPPRAGLDEGTLKLIQDFDNVIYISCNPETFIHNLRFLLKSHELRSVAVFDQFPYTPHLELGAVLRKNNP